MSQNNVCFEITLSLIDNTDMPTFRNLNIIDIITETCPPVTLPAQLIKIFHFFHLNFSSPQPLSFLSKFVWVK